MLKELLHPSRFDLMAKYLYIKSKDKNLETDFFKDLYHKHLITFNGCNEFPDRTVGETGLSKTRIDIFLNLFDVLINNIKNYGYDEKYPIPVGKNGIIVNGSHRLMTSYYYNIIPKIKKFDQNGNMGYNYSFFLNRKNLPQLEAIYADAMALEYIKHNEDVRTMIIYPSGFNTEIMALEHWLKYGRYEKRICKNPNYKPKIAIVMAYYNRKTQTNLIWFER